MQIQVAGKTSWLNFHHLYYFSVIAREGGISAAAQKLRIGQPTLSAQLKQFEASLGVQLFERRHKKLILSETGKLVQEYALELFRMGGEMIEVIHDRLPTQRTHVQIGALDSVPKHLTLEIAQSVLKRGDCVLSILEGKVDELFRELVNHKIDLIVSNFVPTLVENTGLYSRRIARSPVLICGAPKFKALKRNFPSSLIRAPFVMPTGDSKIRHDLEHYFRLAGIQIEIVAETQDTAIQKLMGVAGLGLIPVAATAAYEYLQKGELIEVGRLPGLYEDLYLISASRKIENPISSALMRSFRLRRAHA